MNHWIMPIILAPLLLLQCLWVRVKTPRLPEAEGARKGNGGRGEQSVSLMIFGDSAAAGVGASHQHQALSGNIMKNLESAYQVEWQLEAWSGCTTAEMIQHIKQLPDRQLDMVVTSLGVNDIITGVKLADWLSQQQVLVNLLRQKFSPGMIVLSALPEMKKFPALPQPLRAFIGARADKFNLNLKKYVAAQNDCFHLRLDIADTAALMATDGFHPGPGAYELWGKAVVTALEQNRDFVLDRLNGVEKLSVYSN